MGKSNWRDMREFLDFLEGRGEVMHIEDEVDPDWEVNGITKLVTHRMGPVVVFDKVRGSDYPLVTGLLASERRYLWALGLEDLSELNNEWIKRTAELLAPKIVKAGVCQQEVILESDIDIKRICNIKWHQHDGGCYPGTLSVSITKDPETGIQNAGCYRMATLGKNRLSWGAAPYSHGQLHLTKYERRNEPMPMAVITGFDPVVEIAGATRTPPGIDEFYLAGALRREPLEVVKCKTIDINVPAYAEWVFEGVIQPGIREIDRDFGEVTGYYGEAHSQPVFEIKLITHRMNPLYLGTREGWYPSESTIINGRSSQAEAFKILKGLVPGLLDLKTDVTFEAIAKIDKLFKGHPQQVMDAIWGATYARYKHVIVVDKDIDIWDYNSVHWALSTRVKADRDVYILPRRAGIHRDPALPTREKGWQAGLGIDATFPSEEYAFWGEKVPDTIDDPEILEKTKRKWSSRLKLA